MKNSLLGPLVLLIFISIKASASRHYIVFNHGLTWNEAHDFCKRFHIQNCQTRLMFVCQRDDAYTFVTEAKTWLEAREYCRLQHGDLARFQTSSMNDIFTELDFPRWTGLQRAELSSHAYYVNWTETGLSGEGDCVSIFSLTKLMETKLCDARLPFICFWDGNINLVLVKENKSWEEALEHCRSLNDIGLRFDLVSVESEDDYVNMMSKVMEANTDEVWTGLRFLGDEWLWVNGGNTSNIELPQCPTQEQRCGALSKNRSGSVEARDCSEQKNFLCYSFDA
ncbi:putative C-type lectin domain family 20 member A isoform X2 [Cyprinodon tularosa]|uniref:putative C-type lectin domain family 20 member A isoform X2 n=1 Tax=Cyprinodon tularosa TaxID=77115 RepID=UPI0018E29078|nr:putative C-type lectin domain family 20 member A isoform X2 [Cyprinodon tularosa]